MGKKSRRAKKAEGKSAPRAPMPAASPFSPTTAIASYTSQAAFANPYEGEPTPNNGWARELRDAERDLKQSPDNASVVVRAAKAAEVMRQFDKLEAIVQKAESRGVAFDGEDNQALLQTWKQKCASYNSRRATSWLIKPKMQSYLVESMDSNMNMNLSSADNPLFSNVNALQTAAQRGDVQLVEKLVAMGCALDFASDNVRYPGSKAWTKVKKPPCSTPLLLAVLEAMCCRVSLQSGRGEVTREEYEGAVETAIQLVRLGANVDVRLQVPSGRDENSDYYSMIKRMKWIGKSVRELAPETGSALLVQTTEQFDSRDDKVKLTNCRCGSRLPWKECHTVNSGRYHLENAHGPSDNTITWRISPLAPCPCRYSRKVYFKCCWEEHKHYLRDDETGAECVSIVTAVDGVSAFALGNGRDFLRARSSTGQRQHIVREELADELLKLDHPKSKTTSSWDPKVKDGVMKLLKGRFCWNDVHWNIPKPQLIQEAAEWNEALANYCDDEGLVGQEREKVIELHSANPCAPCANPSCEKIETKVKGFPQLGS